MHHALTGRAARPRLLPQGARSMKALWDGLVQSRFGPHLLAIIAALGVIAPAAIYFVHLNDEYADERRDQAALEAANHARLIEAVVERAVAAPRLLAPLGATEELRRQAASELFRLIAPVEILEIVAASGERLRLEPGVELAAEGLGALPPLTLSGAPEASMQGDMLVASQALQALDAPSEAPPWGHSRAYLGAAQIVAAARLVDLPDEGFGVRLLLVSEGERLLHQGGPSMQGRSAAQVIPIAGSGHLRLEITPAAGHLTALWQMSVLVLFLTAVLSYLLTLRLLRGPLELREQVAHRTSLLNEEKRALEREIARRGELDRQLAQHHAFLEQLLLAMPGPVFAKDSAGHYIELNAACARFFGLSREAMLGKTVFDLMPPELAAVHHRADVQLLARGGSQVYEAVASCADGMRREAVFHKAALLDAEGEVSGIVGIMLDITAHKAVERRLARLNRMLAALSETNRVIARTHDANVLLERVAHVLQECGGFSFAWVCLASTDGPRIVCAPRAGDISQRVAAALSRPGGARPPATRRFCLASECADAGLVRELAAQGLSGLAHLPLWTDGEAVGAIEVLVSDDDSFGADEQRLLEELAANVSFALDALAQERRRQQAEGKLQLAARVFENSAEGIMITDAQNRIVMVNKAFTQVTGYAAEEVIGCNPSLLSSGTQGPEFYRAMWHALKTRGEWHGEIENRRKSGEFYPEWLTISQVRSDSGELTHHVAVFSDLTARKQFEERLNFLAHYDALTSLPNRVLFTDRLQHALAQARADGQRVAVAFLDLDRFQMINDTVGHAVGDRLLQEISGRLANGVRQGDSVSRLGGDEFALILTNLGDTDEAAGRVARIQELLRAPVHALEHELHCSASIGVAIFPDDAQCVESLLKSADAAMYKAMQGGGNSFRFFHHDMNQRTAERFSMEGKLRYALERGELTVYFQPLVSAATGRIVGAEALLRWQRADLGGFVNTTDFVPLLEETGLIGPVGEWVLRTACEENRRWRKLTGEPLFVAVNLSAVQLADADLVAKVEQTLRALDFDPRYLEIELTESAVMRDADAGIRTLRELKALGVRLSLDDFGTGYSSLSHLKRLPIDTLKIDRSFIRDTPDDVEATFLTRAIIAMGHSLRMEIVAEGVETVAQAELLRELDCDVLQGYHFSPAVPAEKFRELLRESSSVAVTAGVLA